MGRRGERRRGQICVRRGCTNGTRWGTAGFGRRQPRADRTDRRCRDEGVRRHGFRSTRARTRGRRFEKPVRDAGGPTASGERCAARERRRRICLVRTGVRHGSAGAQPIRDDRRVGWKFRPDGSGPTFVRVDSPGPLRIRHHPGRIRRLAVRGARISVRLDPAAEAGQATARTSRRGGGSATGRRGGTSDGGRKARRRPRQQ